jgi:hypothetical protein
MRESKDGKTSEQSDQALLAYALRTNDGMRLIALGSLNPGAGAARLVHR